MTDKPSSLADDPAHALHARTAYTDYAPPRPRRHLLRLWLSTPVREGGWTRPFPDGNERKRGGIQVSASVKHQRAPCSV